MKIELHEITVQEVAEKYVDNAEEGVIGYGGKLNIRPKYQREFVYDDKKRNAVMNTIRENFPLNVMYWVKNDDGTFEVMDGQEFFRVFGLIVAHKTSNSSGLSWMLPNFLQNEAMK